LKPVSNSNSDLYTKKKCQDYMTIASERGEYLTR
jgi:hypothetical protein